MHYIGTKKDIRLVTQSADINIRNRYQPSSKNVQDHLLFYNILSFYQKMIYDIYLLNFDLICVHYLLHLTKLMHKILKNKYCIRIKFITYQIMQ